MDKFGLRGIFGLLEELLYGRHFTPFFGLFDTIADQDMEISFLIERGESPESHSPTETDLPQIPGRIYRYKLKIVWNNLENANIRIRPASTDEFFDLQDVLIGKNMYEAILDLDKNCDYLEIIIGNIQNNDIIVGKYCWNLCSEDCGFDSL